VRSTVIHSFIDNRCRFADDTSSSGRSRGIYDPRLFRRKRTVLNVNVGLTILAREAFKFSATILDIQGFASTRIFSHVIYAFIQFYTLLLCAYIR